MGEGGPGAEDQLDGTGDGLHGRARRRHLTHHGAVALEGGLDTDARLEAATGWKLEVKKQPGEDGVAPRTDGRIDKVLPVRLTPYKRRAGFRTKKLTGHGLSDLPRPSDRVAHAALRTSAGVPFIL